jgi:hypothetical protein
MSMDNGIFSLECDRNSKEMYSALRIGSKGGGKKNQALASETVWLLYQAS